MKYFRGEWTVETFDRIAKVGEVVIGWDQGRDRPYITVATEESDEIQTVVERVLWPDLV